MEMCYDGALVMPSSYAVMDEMEMEEVIGGGIKKEIAKRLVGFQYLTGWQQEQLILQYQQLLVVVWQLQQFFFKSRLLNMEHVQQD